jgi:copper-containing nitrite reductase
METRAHNEIPFMKVILSILLFLFMISGAEPLPAQSGANHRPGGNATANAVDIARDPTDVPSAIANRAPTVVHVTLTAKEVLGQLDPSVGTAYRYWTFNEKVPGPMIRVRQGDILEVTLRNDGASHMIHSVDFHAALGPGGGAAFSQAIPGQAKTFTFHATTPGLFVYHCGTPMIAEHIANGMYGLILVEPEGGLPHADHEFYVMQGEVYTTAPKGRAGLQQFSEAKLMAETPEYFVFNGTVDALTKEYPMHANVGETVRVFFGDAGPNDTSSLHVVGEIFTRDYELGSLTSPPLTGIQTASVPPGAAAILEFTASVPGQFTMMDHAMARMAKGLMAVFEVRGAENAAFMHDGPTEPDSGSQVSAAWVTGMSKADMRSGGDDVGPAATRGVSTSPVEAKEQVTWDTMPSMPMHMVVAKAEHPRGSNLARSASPLKPTSSGPTELNGCLILLNDGRAMLRVFQSTKTYRLEARPLLFSENANRLIHVTGELGSVVAVEDPSIPSFVVNTVDELAPNCSAKVTPALLRKALAKAAGGDTGTLGPLTVGMSDMAFMPPKIVIKVGQKVTWKDSSGVIHNVVDDAGKAINQADVHVPEGGKGFDSGLMQPGQTFARVFTAPGVYRYVCTLHEANGMKGVVVVK